MSVTRYILLITTLIAVTAIMQAQSLHAPQEGMIRFTENRGQVIDTRGELRPDVLYTTGSGGVQVYLRKTGLSYVFSRAENVPDGSERLRPDLSLEERHALDSATRVTLYRMDMELVGANPSPRVTSEEVTEEYTNYYLAHCRDGITHVRSYGRVVYHEVYPNIDMVLYSSEEGMKYDFVVYPGGRVTDIRLRYIGSDSVVVDEWGRLCVHTSLGTIIEDRPHCYLQERYSTSRTVDVAAHYRVEGHNVGFGIAVYDSTQLLVVDPSVQWSTYFGAGNVDQIQGLSWPRWSPPGETPSSTTYAIAVGQTTSANLPGYAGVVANVPAAINSFTTKVRLSDGSPVWTTYFGGSNDDLPSGVAADSSGNLYIAGTTRSTNLPTTSTSFQPAFKDLGRCDANMFLAALDSGGVLRWCTYYGGTSSYGGSGSYGRGVAVDQRGDVVLYGITADSTLATSGAFQSGRTSWDIDFDPIITKFSGTGTQIWATYCGSISHEPSEESWGNVAIDRAGNIVFTGPTYGNAFPVTAGAFQTTLSLTFPITMAGFLVKLNPTGTALVWGTYITGSGDDVPQSLAIDRYGNITVTGYTSSTDFPVTTGAFQTIHADASATIRSDGFIISFDSTGNRRWGTYVGGAGEDKLTDIAAFGGEIVAVGTSTSTTFPVTSDASQRNFAGNHDMVLIRCDSIGARRWASYLGGTNYDEGTATLIAQHSFLVGGYTLGSFPVINAAQTTFGGIIDGALTLFCDLPSMTVAVVGPRAFCSGDSTRLQALPGYTYLWSTGATSQTITVRQSGNYWYRAEIAGCVAYSDTVRVTVWQNPQPHITPSGVRAVCQGDSLLLDVGSQFRSYRWSTGDTLSRITVRNAGVYRVTVVDSNGCSASDSVELKVNPLPVARITPLGPLGFCDGDSVRLDAGSGFASYRWSTGASTQTIVVKKSDTVNVRVTSQAGCSAQSPSVITRRFPKAAPTISALGPTTFCAGDSVPVMAMPAKARRYRWSNGDTTQLIWLHTSTSVSVEVIDSNGCVGTSSSLSVQTSDPPRPVISVIGSRRLCGGDSVVLDAGGGYRSYQWSSGERSQKIIVHDAGVYSVSVTDLIGCTGQSDTVGIEVLPRPHAAISGPEAVCPNSTTRYSFSDTANVTIAWSVTGSGVKSTSGTSSRDLTVTWNAGGTGNIHLSVTDPTTGCSADTTLSVTIGSALVPTVTTSRSPKLCPGDSVRLDAGSGYTSYQWSTGATNSSIVVRAAGNYSVTVSADACSGTSKPVVVTLNEPPVPAITTSNGSVICQGDSTVLDAGAGYRKYQWTNGYTTRTVVVRQPGSYAVTVTDTNGCVGSSEMVAVSVEPAPVPVIQGVKVVCRNTSGAYTTKAQAGHSYQWSVSGGTIVSGQGTSSIVVQWGSGGSGTVDVIEHSAIGCSGIAKTLAVEIGDRLEPEIVINGPAAICSGSSVDLDAGGGYSSYAWSTGETTRRISVSSGGSYSVSVTDAGGCSGTSKVVEITQKEAMEVDVTPVGPLMLCDGDSTELRAPAGYARYQWSSGETTPAIIVRRSGSYSVTVSDADGCGGASNSVAVTVNPLPAKPMIAASDDTLRSSLSAQYQWLLDGGAILGATAREIIATHSGSYEVRITDANGCSAISEPFVVLGQPVVWLDTASAAVGERVQLHVHMSPPLKASDGVIGYSARMVVNPRSLFVHGAGNLFAKVAAGQPQVIYQPDGTVMLEYDESGGVIAGGELFALELEGLATGVPVNEVEIQSVVLKGLGKVPVAGNGLVILSGCDISTGFGFGKRVRIESVSPNPVTGEAEIRYRAPVGSRPELVLRDILGREAKRMMLDEGTGGEQRVVLKTAESSSGVYMIELHDRAERAMLPIIITR